LCLSVAYLWLRVRSSFCLSAPSTWLLCTVVTTPPHAVLIHFSGYYFAFCLPLVLRRAEMELLVVVAQPLYVPFRLASFLYPVGFLPTVRGIPVGFLCCWNPLSLPESLACQSALIFLSPRCISWFRLVWRIPPLLPTPVPSVLPRYACSISKGDVWPSSFDLYPRYEPSPASQEFLAEPFSTLSPFLRAVEF